MGKGYTRRVLISFQIKFLNPMITRKPKLRRQRKIFRQQGKIPRPDQMNINVAAWGRLLQRNFFFQKSGDMSEGGSRLEKQSSTTGLSRKFQYVNQLVGIHTYKTSLGQLSPSAPTEHSYLFQVFIRVQIV